MNKLNTITTFLCCIFSLLIWSTAVAQCDNPADNTNGDPYIASLCACDDGSGNVTFTIDIENFPTDCASGYDVGIQYSDDMSGTAIVANMAVMSGSSITFGPIANASDPVSVSLTGIQDLCANNPVSICVETLVTDLAAPMTFTPPAATSEGSCQTAADIQAAFDAWIDSYTTTGGCNVMVTDDWDSVYPNECGEAKTINYTATDGCGASITGSATFTVDAPDPVALNIPADSTVMACTDQAVVDAAYAEWLNGASATGGCNVSISDDAPASAPMVCAGGDITVTWTASSDCEGDVMMSSVFSVTPPDIRIDEVPADSTVMACTDQAVIDAAFAEWLNGATVTGGCNASFTDNSAGAPDACGGVATVEWTFTDDCNNDNILSATFTVTDAPAVSLMIPMDSTVMACEDQAVVDAAFAEWLNGVVLTGGCNASVADDNTGAPDACGGMTTVTWTATSDCDDDVVMSATFTVTDAPAVAFTAPDAVTYPVCRTQAYIDAEFMSWLNSYSLSGGCNTSIDYGNPTAPDFCGGSVDVQFTVTSDCEADIVEVVTFLVDGCLPGQGAAYVTGPNNPWNRLTNNEAMDLVFGSGNWTKYDFATVDVAMLLADNNFLFLDGSDRYANELEAFLMTNLPALEAWVMAGNSLFLNAAPNEGNGMSFGFGGVNLDYSNSSRDVASPSPAHPIFAGPHTPVVTTYTGTAFGHAVICPLGMSATVLLEDAVDGDDVAVHTTFGSGNVIFGGMTTTNFHTPNPQALNLRANMISYLSSLIPAAEIMPCPAFTLTVPPAENIMECMTQADVDAAFNAWLMNVSTTGGCRPTITNDSGSAPDACDGGTATVTWTLTSECDDDIVLSSTFTVDPAPAITLTAPADETLAACMTQADVDAAFNTFLTGYTVSGGCTPVTVSNSPSSVPMACGSTTEVTWTAMDGCTTETASANFEVTAPDPIMIPCSDEMIMPDMSQADAEAAYTAWLDGIVNSSTGGCNLTITTSPANLVNNPDGSDGLNGWNILATSGSGWLPYGNGFRNSFKSCGDATATNQMAQEIDLIALGYTADFLDTAPEVVISELVTSSWANNLCGGLADDSYYVRYELRDASHSAIASFNDGTIASPSSVTSASPVVISETFTGYGTGLRYLYIEQGGADNGYWFGYYGSDFSNIYAGIAQPVDVCSGSEASITFTSTDDCLASETCTATFTVPAATIAANPMGAGSVCLDTPVQVNGKPSAGSGMYTHNWTVVAGTGTFSDATAQAPEFTATSTGNVVLEYTVTDAVSACTAMGQVTLYVQMDCDYEFKVEDPCVCNNDADVNQDNGTFMEVITITGPNGAALPDGQSWNLYEVTGGFSASPFNEESMPGPQGAPLAAGQVFTYCNNINGCTVYNLASGDVLTAPFGSYYLVFAHTDAEGYCASVQGPDPDNDADPATPNPANTQLSVCNTCFYPDVAVLNMPATICVSDDPITIQGIPTATGEGTWNGEATFVGGNPPYDYDPVAGLTDNGDGTATFDPAAAGPGVYTLSYTFEDQAAVGGSEPGCFQAVQANITVAPNVTPSFTDDDDDNIVCLGQTVTLTGDPLGGVFTGVGVTDNGDGTATFMVDAVGDYSVTYSFTNGCSAAYTETYTTDNIEPEITCPSDIAVANDPGVCGATVTYPDPVVDDNCGISSATSGGTPLTMMFEGSNSFQSTYAEAGMFIQAVNHIDAPWNIGGRQGARIHRNYTSVWTYNGGEEFTPVSVDVVAGSMTFVAQPSGASFTPMTTGVVNFPSTPDWENITSMEWNENGSGDADIDDFSFIGGEVSQAYELVSGISSGAVFPIGTTVNTFVVTDDAGNTASCSFEVVVADEEDPTITCPADAVITTSNLGSTGDCAGQYSWTHPVANDNCGIQIFNVTYTNPDGTVEGPSNVDLGSTHDGTQSVDANRQFAVGVTTVSYFVEDASGNTVECSFTVTVTDDEAPTFVTCANGTSFDVFTNDCQTGLIWDIPTADDNCSVTVAQTAGPAYGTVVGPGTYTIEYTATDPAGLTAVCSFTINVLDTENPILNNCPFNDQVLDVDANCEGILPDYTTRTNVFENCPGITVVQVPAPGTVFAVGDVVAVTVTATDASGNASSCVFNVNVEDNTLPTVLCNLPQGNSQMFSVLYDFESGTQGWTTGNEPSTSYGFASIASSWTLRSTAEGTAGLTLPSTMFGTNNNGSSGAEHSWILSPANVIDANMVSITFDSYSANEGGYPIEYDVEHVEISLNGGPFTSLHAFDPNLHTYQDTTLRTITYMANITSGDEVSFRFRYDTGDDCCGESDIIGWYIDNVLIEAIQSTQPILYLDANGEATISVADVDAGSFDNCGIASSVLSITDFSCANVGSNTVALTVTDVNGNSASCLTEVIVQDTVPPVIVCNDLALTLDEQGNATITIDDVLTSASDNCAIASSVVDRTFFDCNNVGDNTVTVTVTDIYGNVSTCESTVTITDDQDPVFLNCAMNSTTDVFTNACETSITWDIPVAEDNCMVTVVQAAGPTYGSAVAPGLYTIEYTATDASGNNAVCTFDINVIDSENPILNNCPFNDQVLDVDANCEGILPDYTIRTNVFENCPGITVVQTPAPGTVYAVGDVVAVSVTATDASGNSSSCDFDVLVQDNTLPTVLCNVQTGAQVFDVLYDFETGAQGWTTGNEATTSDGYNSIPSTWVVGDVASGTASFGLPSNMYGVTNNGDDGAEHSWIESPAHIINANMVSISFDSYSANESGYPTFYDVEHVEISINGSAYTSLHASDPNLHGLNDQTLRSISYMSSINEGDEVRFRFRYDTGDDCCGSDDIVGWYVDNVRIQAMISSQPVLVLDENGEGSITVADVDAGSFDNCGIASSELNITDFNCDNIGSNTVTLTVTDVNGNSASCLTEVVVVDQTAPVVVCNDLSLDLDGQGSATIVVDDVLTSATDNCGIASTTIDNNFFNCDNVGPNTVVVTVTDVSGNVSTCEAIVTITDNEAPTFVNCPGNSTVDVFTNDCETSVTWSIPVAEDNCGATVTQTGGPAYGTIVAPGTYVLEYTATDAAGLTDVCSFEINVIDTENPVLSCPDQSALTVKGTNSGCEFVMASNDFDATYSENCSPLMSLTHNYTSASSASNNTLNGHTFPLGNTTIIWTAVDAAGNTAQCSFVVTVEDDDAPTFTCPSDLDVQGCAGTVPDLISNLTGSDNCSNVAFTQDPVAGTQFGPNSGDIVVVTITAADDAGNTTSCDVNVTIIDSEMPVFLDCPLQPIVVGNDTDDCGALVNWDIPVVLDNCDQPLLAVQTAGPANGTMLAVGTYTVVYTATDADGNIATCTFDVVVEDTQAPTLGAGIPIDMTLNCQEAASFEPFIMTSDMLVDNCTDPVTDIQNNYVSGQGNDPAMCDYYTYEDLYEWVATDDAGNSMTWRQKVMYEDTEAPFQTLPLDVTIECGESTDPANTGQTTAVDNCADPAYIDITYTDVSVPGCGLTEVITRTWTSTDPCGNSVSADQVITVLDRTAPTLVCMDITVELDENGEATISAMDVIDMVSDVCSDPDSLKFAMDRTMFTCADLGPNTVRLVVTDECGNMADCTPTVTVVDRIDPEIICFGDQTINLAPGECDYQVPGGASATDNCSAVVTFSPDISTMRLGPGVHVITATATDIDGNTAECEFTYTIIEFDPASDDLTCNGNINLSLGPDCTAEINPDMILEGSNYGCYDDYCITIETEAGLPHSNFFDLSDVNKTFKVAITDCLGSGNTCWGYVTIEEKLIPEIECPADIEISCNINPDDRDPQTGELITGELIVNTCEPSYNTWYEDAMTDNGACTDPRAVVSRTWYLEDESGNVVTCVQTITITGFDLDDVVFPDNYDINNPFDCEAVADNPLLITPEGDPNDPDDGTGYPSLDGVPVQYAGNLCGASVNVTDEIYDICDGSYEILRTWKVRDMCGPVTSDNPRVHTQVIKVLDTSGPKMGLPIDDITISTDPWSCEGKTILPNPTKLVDVCSDVANFRAEILGRGVITTTGTFEGGNLEIEASGILANTSAKVRYIATDDCGNETVYEFYVTVLDKVAPVVSTIQDIVITLDPGAPGFESSSKVFVEAVDNHSYDACTDVHIELRRPAGSPACSNEGLNGYNNNVSFNNATPRLHADDNEEDTDDGRFVKVCCEDQYAATIDVNGDGVIDTGYIEVIMRVWDDANGTGVYGDVDANGHPDNYNEAWAHVKVEDNLPPVITCPADATISCYWTIDLSTDFGPGFQDASLADFEKTGMAVAYSTCKLENIEFNDRPSLDDCGIGTITRTWRVSKDTKNGGVRSECRQIITVDDYQSTFAVTPPRSQPTYVDGCSLKQEDLDKNKPTATGGICDVIGENVKVDTFLFEGGVCKKWVATYEYTNWCTGEHIDGGQAVFLYEDTQAPVIECEDVCYGVDADCQYTYTFNKSATDNSGCSDNGWLKWLVTFDAWADGTVDYAASSFAPTNYTTWRTDAALSAQYGLPASTQWIYITPTSSGDVFTQRNGQPLSIPEDLGGKMSNHKVTYKVTDGCHNYSSCTEDVMVADKKAPTPYCTSISTALMADPDGDGPQGPMVELWACDFNLNSFDNCSPAEDLAYTFDEIPYVVSDTIQVGSRLYIVNIDVPHYFDESGFVDFNGDGGLFPVAKAGTLARYAAGDIQKWIPETKCSGQVFTCDDAPQAQIKMSVWDKKLNTDYCDVFVTFGGTVDCDGMDGRVISGNIVTDQGSPVENVEVFAMASNLELTRTTTNEAGKFAFQPISTLTDVNIEAKRDGDDDNGVSTLDLVLIQRHIIGLAAFTDPYDMIAADINNNNTVSGADVVELRKLVLGVITEYSANDSWRFVDATSQMEADEALPFTEKLDAPASDNDQTDMNLIAVKIGDINNSAETLEGRSAHTLGMNFTNRAVAKGDIVDVVISSEDYIEMFGYQFTLNMNQAEFIGIAGLDLDMSESNYAKHDDMITVSYAGTDAETAHNLFQITFKALTDGNVSDFFNLSSDITKAESYVLSSDGVINVSHVTLSERVETQANYELFQNEPNPFEDMTVLSWNMAETGYASITISDVAGRTLKVFNGEFGKGKQTMILNKKELNVAPGVLFYTLKAGEYTATKKMILVD